MHWRLFGSGFICLVLAICVAPIFADEAGGTKSPLNDPDDPSVISSIDRMKRRLTAGQISDRVRLNLKLIEVEPERLNELIFVPAVNNSNSSLFYAEPLKPVDRLTWYGLWDSVELDRLTRHPETPIWSAPPLLLVSGCESRYRLGGRIERPSNDGRVPTADVNYGRSIVATATITDYHRIRLAVASEIEDLTPNGTASTGNCRRIDATLDLDPGVTRVVGRKVVSSSGKETCQLILATAWLESLEVLSDPEMSAVSAVNDISTPEKDVVELGAKYLCQSHLPESAHAKRGLPASSGPNSSAADDSMLVRHLQRMDDGRAAEKVLMSIVVTEVTREDYERASQHRRCYHFRAWMPTFYSSFSSDVVEVETTGNPFASRLQCTELEYWTEGTRFCRPNSFTYRGTYLPINTWKMPKTLVESGNKLLWKSGGEIPVVTLDQDRCESIANKPFGLTLNAVPTITDMDETQIHLDVALTDLVQGAKSLRVESTRRMQATVRVRNGEVVSFGQPAVSDTGRESFLCFSVMANTVHPNYELAATDDEPISALHPENCDSKCPITPVNRSFANLFGAGTHQSCWADSIPTQFQQINHILHAVEHRQLPHPDAEMTQLSYRLAHPFDESSTLFADP